MKKLFLFVFLFAFNLGIYAGGFSHFSQNIVGRSLTIDSVEQICSQYFVIPDNSLFRLSKVMPENDSIIHYRFSQYLDDILIEGASVLVHTNKSIIQSINGCVLEKDKTFHSISKRKINTLKTSNDNIDIVVIETSQKDIVYAYKYTDESLGMYVYINIENNDTVEKIPFQYNIQSQINTNTIYSGRQKVTIDKNNSGICFYKKSNPKIETICATNQDFRNMSASNYAQQISNCDTYSEYEKDSAQLYLATVTFKLTGDDSWWNRDEGNLYDLYITIVDNKGNEVYRSIVIDEYEYTNITFAPLFPLNGTQYSIYLYDEDVISDDCAGGFTIMSTSKGRATISLSFADVTINVTNNPIHDAHWGMEKTLDYYSTKFNWNSYDNNGSTVYQFVNPIFYEDSKTYKIINLCNAYARTEYPYCMVYGLGDGISMNPVVLVDVMAHEFTHLVTYHSINGLEYKGESGAINESLLDIFGQLVKGYTYGIYDWVIGNNLTITSPFLRSMSDPHSSGQPQPKTYQGKYWKDPTETKCDTCDIGGVHQNCGVMNYWFYLLCCGGNGINDNGDKYNVTGLGIDTATAIIHNVHLFRLPAKATFPDARNATLEAIKQLYPNKKNIEKSVTNAWYAIGVGDAYSEEFELTPGKYVIVTNRNVGKDNWFYMTSGLGTASTKRLQAVNSGVQAMDDVEYTNLPDSMVWELVKDGTNWKLKNGTKYLSWTSGNSATLDATGKSLTFEIGENRVNAHFNDGTDERYLSLNGTAGNDYLAFYKESVTTSIKDLYFLPYKEKEKSKEYVILARRSNKSNWFYMTSEKDGTTEKPKDRFKAVDSGISTSIGVATTSLDDKYYWTIETTNEGTYLKSKTGYFVSWSSGNTALLEKSGLLLDYTESANAGFKWFFLTDTSGSEPQTRYLSLNKTDGNNYFAFYPAQVKDLLVIEKGGGIPTDLDQLTDLPSDRFTKIIKDGQLYILRDGKTYNAQGTEVR